MYESLDHAGIHHHAKVRVVRIDSEKLAAEGAEKLLAGVDGLLVPGGFDKRGIEGKIDAIRFARENGLPFFGICLGLQCATIEFARNVVGLAEANSTEFNPDDAAPGRLPAGRAAGRSRTSAGRCGSALSSASSCRDRRRTRRTGRT